MTTNYEPFISDTPPYLNDMILSSEFSRFFMNVNEYHSLKFITPGFYFWANCDGLSEKYKIDDNFSIVNIKYKVYANPQIDTTASFFNWLYVFIIGQKPLQSIIVSYEIERLG